MASVVRDFREIALSDIYADRAWNGRRSIGDDESGGPDAHGFDELVTSLELKGQDEPVTVRPYYRQAVGLTIFELVAGYRRFYAGSRLAQVGKTIANVKPGHILAEVRALSDYEARALNGRENISRTNLNAADSAFLVAELLAIKPGVTDDELGAELGFTTWYVSMLRRVYEGLSRLLIDVKGKPTSCFEYWREHPTAASVRDLFVLTNGRQSPQVKERQFAELVSGGRKPAMGEYRKNGKKTMAFAFGERLGKLEREGMLFVQSSEWKKMLVYSGVLGMNTADELLERAANEARFAYELNRVKRTKGETSGHHEPTNQG